MTLATTTKNENNEATKQIDEVQPPPFSVQTAPLYLSATLKNISQHIWNSAKRPLNQRQNCELNHEHYRFWTSHTALMLYGVLILAALTRKPVVLKGVWIILLWQILWILLQWLLFITLAPGFQRSFQMIKGWLRIVLQQGRKIVHGKFAWTSGAKTAAANFVPMSWGYFLVKARQVRMRFFKEVVESEANRYEQNPIELAKEKSARTE